MSKTQLLLKAAVTGMIGAAVANINTSSAFAAEDASNTKGHCVGANACKGKGACKQESNKCAGKNACAGKGFVEKTKTECELLAKQSPEKKIVFNK